MQYGNLSVIIPATKPQLLYLPHYGLSRGTVLERAVGLMYSLPLWDIAIRQDGALDVEELSAQVRVCTERVKLRHPFLQSHLDALRHGRPLTNVLLPGTEEDQGEAAATELAAKGKEEAVPDPVEDAEHKNALRPAKRKARRGPAAQTASSSSSDGDDNSPATVSIGEGVLTRGKRQREEAAANASSVSSPQKRSRSTRGRAAEKVSEQPSEDTIDHTKDGVGHGQKHG